MTVPALKPAAANSDALMRYTEWAYRKRELGARAFEEVELSFGSTDHSQVASSGAAGVRAFSGTAATATSPTPSTCSTRADAGSCAPAFAVADGATSEQ